MFCCIHVDVQLLNYANKLLRTCATAFDPCKPARCIKLCHKHFPPTTPPASCKVRTTKVTRDQCIFILLLFFFLIFTLSTFKLKVINNITRRHQSKNQFFIQKIWNVETLN